MSCSQIPAHGKWHNFCMGAAKLFLGSPDLWGWLVLKSWDMVENQNIELAVVLQ